MLKGYSGRLKIMGGRFFTSVVNRFMGYRRILSRSLMADIDSQEIFEPWPLEESDPVESIISQLHHQMATDESVDIFLKAAAPEFVDALAGMNEYLGNNSISMNGEDHFGEYVHTMMAYLFTKNSKRIKCIAEEVEKKADINHGHDFNVKQDTLTLNMSNVNVTVNIKKVDDLEARISALENSFSSPK